MRNKKRTSLYLLSIVLMLSACTTPAPADGGVEEVTISAKVTDAPEATATALPTATPLTYLAGPVDIPGDLTFCKNEEASSQFSAVCSENGLRIFESDQRRRSDILLTRSYPLDTKTFILSADVTSQPASKEKLDENSFGFFYQTASGEFFAVRIQGQNLRFEEWETLSAGDMADAYNAAFSPDIHFAGRVNHLEFICDFGVCSLYANSNLVGRSPYPAGETVVTAGFFAASAWDEDFGEILVESFAIAEMPVNRPETQPFFLMDDLQEDHGTFARMGLSGAFSEFEADGFHFSPVIPYGYYAAKSGPAMRDVSISAEVEMEFTPGRTGTQYAGVSCRANADGVYHAVLRVDGKYFIYRDAERRPFTPVALGWLDDVPEGRGAYSLQLDCIGDTLTFYVNGEQIESFTDTRYGIRYGRSGLFTKAGGGAWSGAIVFRDLVIKEILPSGN